MPSSEGRDILRFKVLYSGSATLTLAYERSWEETEPLKAFSVNVVVD